MAASTLQARLATAIETKLGSPVFAFRQKPVPETIPSGIAEMDSQCGEIPRGVLTEIAGPPSSGRTTLLHSILAGATQRGEACALVDSSDSFDPASAAAAGADLERLLWVRCGTKSPADKNHAIRVTDLLLQNGGWGVIVLDLADIEPKDARRIPLHTWHRFRLAIENKPTAFIVIGQQPYAASCSALVLETQPEKAIWQEQFLRGAVFQARRRKPPGRTASFVRGNGIKK